MGSEPAAWIWWEWGLDRKATTVRLAGCQSLWRSKVKGMGVERGSEMDFSLRSWRTMGACWRVWPEFSPAVTLEWRSFSVMAIQRSKVAVGGEEGDLSRAGVNGAAEALEPGWKGGGGRVKDWRSERVEAKRDAMAGGTAVPAVGDAEEGSRVRLKEREWELREAVGVRRRRDLGWEAAERIWS